MDVFCDVWICGEWLFKSEYYYLCVSLLFVFPVQVCGALCELSMLKWSDLNLIFD